MPPTGPGLEKGVQVRANTIGLDAILQSRAIDADDALLLSGLVEDHLQVELRHLADLLSQAHLLE